MPETPRRKPREVEIVRPSYRPGKKELEEDLRVDATFEEAVDAVTRPVSIGYIDRPRAAK